MLLTPRELDKLTVYIVADLARKRRERGVKLNYAEAVALISEAILEGARDGRTVSELMDFGRTVVRAEECMAGVPELVAAVQIEATFPDGTKLVTCHEPIGGIGNRESGIGDGAAAHGLLTDAAELSVHGAVYLLAHEDIAINDGREMATLTVSNTGDRAIQVGSHFHFFEVNRALRFDRAAALGRRLDIPAGTALRFEPGDTREVNLVALGGARRALGFNGLVNGSTVTGRAAALNAARAAGFSDEGQG